MVNPVKFHLQLQGLEYKGSSCLHCLTPYLCLGPRLQAWKIQLTFTHAASIGNTNQTVNLSTIEPNFSDIPTALIKYWRRDVPICGDNKNPQILNFREIEQPSEQPFRY